MTNERYSPIAQSNRNQSYSRNWNVTPSGHGMIDHLVSANAVKKTQTFDRLKSSPRIGRTPESAAGTGDMRVG